MKIISPINEIKQIVNLINVHNYHCLEKIKNVAEQWWSAPGMPLEQRALATTSGTPLVNCITITMTFFPTKKAFCYRFF